ncbi:hypothetical protein DDB_G0285345 [Dictyostelium discoideum AX4]|uniref:Uncharacterized transmembrane protein SSD449 n=1 Tax=Dictyostelium discoideum TaxID=44689 RepID=Y5202_DICDI|nr:hypothetical protein DDB_G0285345 [Dictyostelium discoideum AX4]Q54ND0.1 RecName: Full=Uncharacterized transmembrane protein SSD449 [Dictyostelium discoideum]EAL64747.1 hypothetical protein DDB_G0285345 [Dictyostelium discoideum AX4]|eukprot:XP_638250.1 hypothetical protein DDB_G0285345 [Dictyostelium discoideum AX4]
MARIDYATAPLFVIVGLAVVLTGATGYKRLSSDQDISLTRKGQMLWKDNPTHKFVDRNTTMGYFKTIETGKYLKE